MPEPTPQESFAAAVRSLPHGGIGALATLAGISRSTIERKRDGKIPVTPWDVWAIERGVALVLAER